MASANTNISEINTAQESTSDSRYEIISDEEINSNVVEVLTKYCSCIQQNVECESPSCAERLCFVCYEDLPKSMTMSEEIDHYKGCFENTYIAPELKHALELSKEHVCSICLEKVMSKKIDGQRRFGILSQCDHAFCWSCLKTVYKINWNFKGVFSCPFCRTKSEHFIPTKLLVTDSTIKEEIVKHHKAKSKIPCYYFTYLNGQCPHRWCCFYRHVYPKIHQKELLQSIFLKGDDTKIGEPGSSTIVASHVLTPDDLPSDCKSLKFFQVKIPAISVSTDGTLLIRLCQGYIMVKADTPKKEKPILSLTCHIPEVGVFSTLH